MDRTQAVRRSAYQAATGREQRLPDREEGLDLRQALNFIARRRGVIFYVAAITAILLSLIVLLKGETYAARAIVMITPQQSDAAAAGRHHAGADPDSGFVNSQIEIMHSPKLIGALVDRLRLAEDRSWNGEWPLNLSSQAISTLKRWNIYVPVGRPRLERRADAIDKVGAALSARRKGLSFIIEIEARAANPKQAAAIANAAVELYLDAKLQQRIAANENASKWLSERLLILKDEVQRKEAAVEAFRAETGLLTAEGASLVERQITALQGSVINARADLAERQARYQQVQTLTSAGGAPDTIAGSLNSDTIRQLRGQEGEIIRRQADFESRYGEAHPAIAQVRLERSEIEAQIKTEIDRITANVKNEVDVAQARVSVLQANLLSLQSQAVSDNAESVKLRELERDSDATRTVYEAFLARYQQASETASFKGADAQVVAEATIPAHPDGIGLHLLLLQSFGLGLAFGLLVAALIDLADDGLGGGEAAVRKLGRPALASIPLLGPADFRGLPPADRRPAAYLVERPMSPFAEGLRALRTTILYQSRGLEAKLICVTSSAPNEGKTTTSLCLARVAAMAGQKVILLDCDLRRRSLSATLGVEPSLGVLDALLGRCDWRSAVITDPMTSLHVLPAADAVFTPRDVFGSDAWRALLEELRGAYDLIILDCPPVLAVAETRIISRFADQTILVVRWAKTPASAARTAIEQLEKAGGFVSGVALNFVDPAGRGRLSYTDTAYQSRHAKLYYAS